MEKCSLEDDSPILSVTFVHSQQNHRDFSYYKITHHRCIDPTGNLKDVFVLIGAAKRSSAPSQPERRIAAVMEAGRALVAALLPSTGLIPFRVSIVPRVSAGDGDGGSLGFTQFLPEERYLLSSDDIADRLTVLVAGRAAEEFVFRASSDG